MEEDQEKRVETSLECIDTAVSRATV